MSTDSPIPTAPELPTPSHNNTTEGDAWNSAFSDISGANADGTTSTPTNSTTSDTTNEAPNINEKMTTPTPSSTAYSFAGSALNSENIRDNNKGSTDSDKAAGGDKEEEKVEESMFECNICLDTAKDAVVSMCGHLFCWPCLHQWLETRPTRKLCPVCKAAIGKDKVIPLYGRNSAKQEDPRYVIVKIMIYWLGY